jgi:hypothetical protein
MYIRRKLYSNIEGELVPVNETKLFAAKDDAKGAAVGAGIATTGAGLAAGGAYGAGKLAGKLQAKRVAAAQKEGIDLVGPGKAEKILRNANLNAKNAVKWAGKHKLAAGGIAVGTLAGAAAAGAGIKHLADKKAEKQYSVLMTEEEYKMFSEMIEAQKEFGDKIDGKNIRIGSKARIWADKHLQTKKDREAMIEAYDQEGTRNSHKLGKQAAKWATGGAAVGLAGAGVAAAVSNPEEAKEVANRVGRVLKVATKNKKVAKAVAKDAAKIGGGIGALGAGIAGGAYLGTRGGRLIGKGIENISESASHQAQKTADENKVASGKMSKEDFAKKYGKNVRLDSNK